MAKKVLTVLCVAAALAILPATAKGAITGTIVGANINAAGTQVSVSNMRVEFDSCGGSDVVAGLTGCGAVAGVVPASQTCPPGTSAPRNLWDPGSTFFGVAGFRTFDSGSRSVTVSSPVAYRICLYSYFDSTNFGPTTPALRADAITPTPNPPSQPPPPPSQPPAGPVDEEDQAACDKAKSQLAKAKATIKKLKRKGAAAKKIKRAKAKVKTRKQAVRRACS